MGDFPLSLKTDMNKKMHMDNSTPHGNGHNHPLFLKVNTLLLDKKTYPCLD